MGWRKYRIRSVGEEGSNTREGGNGKEEEKKAEMVKWAERGQNQ